MTILKIILAFIAINIALYLFTCFVLLNPNPSTWWLFTEQEGRVILIFIELIILLFIFLIVSHIDLYDIED